MKIVLVEKSPKVKVSLTALVPFSRMFKGVVKVGSTPPEPAGASSLRLHTSPAQDPSTLPPVVSVKDRVSPKSLMVIVAAWAGGAHTASRPIQAQMPMLVLRRRRERSVELGMYWLL